MSSEQQKTFVLYMVRMIRGSYLINKSLPELTLLTDDEKNFAANFSKFVTDNNINHIYKLLNDTYYGITRNANKKILWTNTLIKFGIFLRKAGN